VYILEILIDANLLFTLHIYHSIRIDLLARRARLLSRRTLGILLHFDFAVALQEL